MPRNDERIFGSFNQFPFLLKTKQHPDASTPSSLPYNRNWFKSLILLEKQVKKALEVEQSVLFSNFHSGIFNNSSNPFPSEGSFIYVELPMRI